MLLWVMILCITNYFIYKLYNEKNNEFVTKSLQIQSVVTVGFLLFLLITSNPFKKMILIPKNGLGFNPILQDPALAVHPPLLYIGYVGLSAVFSLSVATMNLKNPNKIEWYTYMKPFVITAWSCLTAGIALGSNAKVCTLVNIPDLTKKVPITLSKKDNIQRSKIQDCKDLFLLTLIRECNKAVESNQGINAAFSTGSQNHHPPQPNS